MSVNIINYINTEQQKVIKTMRDLSEAKVEDLKNTFKTVKSIVIFFFIHN